MATKKKQTNYIAAEIANLEMYITQLQEYLNRNPPDQMNDRYDITVNMGTGETVKKLISRKEDQIKSFRETLKELPKLYLELNALRLLANDADNTPKIEKARGGQELPGLFKKRLVSSIDDLNVDDDADDEE